MVQSAILFSIGNTKTHGKIGRLCSMKALHGKHCHSYHTSPFLVSYYWIYDVNQNKCTARSEPWSPACIIQTNVDLSLMVCNPFEPEKSDIWKKCCMWKKNRGISECSWKSCLYSVTLIRCAEFLIQITVYSENRSVHKLICAQPLR